MEFLPLEERLRDELQNTDLVPGVRVDADVLTRRLAEAEQPYLPGIEVDFSSMSRSERLAAYRNREAARLLRAELVQDFETPDRALTYMAWYCEGQPVIKHFSVEPVRGYRVSEHLFLPPAVPEVPRSELIVRAFTSRCDLQVRGVGRNQRNPSHMDKLVDFRPRWQEVMTEANAVMARQFTAPSDNVKFDYRRLAQEVRAYVLPRIKDDFSLS